MLTRVRGVRRIPKRIDGWLLEMQPLTRWLVIGLLAITEVGSRSQHECPYSWETLKSVPGKGSRIRIRAPRSWRPVSVRSRYQSIAV